MSMAPDVQRMEALATANARRIGVAEFKRDTRRLGTRGAALHIADIMDSEDPGEMLGSPRVRHLLLCIPRLGQHKIGKVLDAAGVRAYDRKVRDLTPRQRSAIAVQLRLWVEEWERNKKRTSK